ncbi:hypothetical protein QFC19_007786 [Naganishia cerealis]|uniref:Uncharacterized protein n=1 Tax=Naganishia cerealis TaxID=610337 RepID=A0ACC2V7E7_9TREE|nr:hypothetical protein QFC19_007786 [Naganishia cerealis]
MTLRYIAVLTEKKRLASSVCMEIENVSYGGNDRTLEAALSQCCLLCGSVSILIGAGNIHQLCMQQHTFDLLLSASLMDADDSQPYLSAALPPYWSFTLAQNFIDSSRTGDLDYAKQCAKAVGVDWEKSGVAHCVGSAGSDDYIEEIENSGEEGQHLLMESVQKLKELDVS